MGQKTKRGTVKPTTPAPKQNFIQHRETFDGLINRSYESAPKFQVIEPGQKPYIVHSRRALDQLRKSHPTWTINEYKF
ncbi:hypothetical protein LZD49_26285 [Dyadobacter sp. CY261]|uniref:hypothetical protein n=1 Tax=Dyadobacter sp. CY261 TaxID=2907203 RepID=UPI001F3ADEC4|nr:hypothetical protein [Dyadobacter sp. CY261]MCF0074018.1 hypothetical protein [Dyadobacter sp. CY261]